MHSDRRDIRGIGNLPGLLPQGTWLLWGDIQGGRS